MLVGLLRAQDDEHLTRAFVTWLRRRLGAAGRLPAGVSDAEGRAAALPGVTDPDRLGRVGDWIIECESASDLLARVRGDGRSDG